MQGSKEALALICLTIASIVLALTTQLSYAQFMPCRIVNLNVIPPSSVQAGQQFQVTSELTVSCDPSVLSVVRIDLLDPATSQMLSTSFLPYYSYSSSFSVSVTNQAMARQLSGSWALQVQAHVINGVNGQSAASSSQSFAVTVEPYVPPATEMQTENTLQPSTTSLVAPSLATLSAITNQSLTETTLPNQMTFNTEATTTSTVELLVPVAIVLAGLVVFALLIFAGHRRSHQPIAPTKYCGKCGGKLEENENYCTACGAKQRN